MVRQDRGFDPNLVDLVSCRLTKQTGRDSFSVSVGNFASYPGEPLADSQDADVAADE